MRTATLVFALLVLAAPGAWAAEPEDLANDISSNVMSPFCAGVTLHDCPSDTAVALREKIEGWARDGMSRTGIMARLEQQYGPSIRAVPGASGSGLIAWALPITGLLLATGVGVFLSKRFSAAGDRAPTPRTSANSEERSRLESELNDLRGPA